VKLSVDLADDPALINAVLRDPWIAARVRHDGREPGYIDDPNLAYYAARVDGRIAGVFMAIAHSRWEVEVHAALARWATPYGRKLGLMFLDELWSAPDLMRITAPVLATLPSAVNYCHRLGFEREGVKRSACRIDGAAVDVVYLGLLRSEEVSDAAHDRNLVIRRACDLD
jgi:RimJ/RimL family protein N-acetyltransferase